jgi:hypothetical protein
MDLFRKLLSSPGCPRLPHLRPRLRGNVGTVEFVAVLLSVQRVQTGQSINRGSIPGKRFLFSTASKPALGPTQPTGQWVPGCPPVGKSAGT